MISSRFLRYMSGTEAELAKFGRSNPVLRSVSKMVLHYFLEMLSLYLLPSLSVCLSLPLFCKRLSVCSLTGENQCALAVIWADHYIVLIFNNNLCR
jgi:hypothetical protein